MKPLVAVFVFTILVLIVILGIVIFKPEKPPVRKVISKPTPKKQLPPSAETSQRRLFKEPPPPAQLREDIKELAIEDPGLVARIIKKWLREKIPVQKIAQKIMKRR